MTSNKRQRELARAKYERQQARRANQGSRRRRNQRIVAVLVVVALVFGSVAWVVLAHRSNDDSATATPSTGSSLSPSEIAALAGSALNSAAASASPGASDTASPAPSATGTASDTAAPTSEAAPLDCASPGTPRANDKTYSTAPTDGTATTLSLTTNCGDIVIALDPKAPKTVASLAFLAKDGFYNDTKCHRLTTEGIYVLQCGDPAGDGTGGPGYTVPDENLPASTTNNYPAGTVAMANAGPNTGGSQFFLVYQDTTLPGDYSIVGTITQGLDIVQAVAAAGTADGSADGAPKQPVFIQTASVQQ